jgi:hypothetical protein
MLRKSLTLTTALLLCLIVPSAYAGVQAGVALGQQSYRSSIDDPRVLSSVDVLLTRAQAGVHVAGEYADLSEEGALTVIHVDVVYRWTGKDLSLLIGAGPTFVNMHEQTMWKATWNAEIEIGHSFGSVELFGRLRQYDFNLPRFHEGEAGPRGPAVYAGVRFTLVR